MILITGGEGGLGAYIQANLGVDLGETVINIPRNELRHKANIDKFINKLEVAPTMLINNFGINHLSWIGETECGDEDIMHYNVMVPYWIINALVARGFTDVRVINIASQTYKVAQRCTSLYCASKAALVHMTKVMARELASKGWIINALAPGKIIDTDMSQMTDEQVLDLRGWSVEDADMYALSNIPAGRFTDRAEVYEAILQLALMPSYVNGTCLDMTGGT